MRAAGLALDVSDVQGGAGAVVHQRNELRVEFVDAAAQRGELGVEVVGHVGIVAARLGLQQIAARRRYCAMRMAQQPIQPATRPADFDGWGVVGELQAAGDSLAQAGRDAGEAVSASAGVAPQWPGRAEMLDACRGMDGLLAAVLLVAGAGYLAAGYMLFKLLVVLNVAALGAWGGWYVADGFGHPLAGLAVGGILAGAMAWPAMRYTVALCAGLVGFAVGVAVWRSLGLLDAYAPAGGMIGAVFLSMLSFALFKLSIITFTSVQGAAMVAAGALGLLMKYDAVAEPVRRFSDGQPVALPVALLVVAVVGLLFQQHYYRDEGK